MGNKNFDNIAYGDLGIFIWNTLQDEGKNHGTLGSKNISTI